VDAGRRTGVSDSQFREAVFLVHIMYDTLKHYKAFVNSGMDERQAQALVYALRDAGQEIRQARKNARKTQRGFLPKPILKNIFKH
jgi:hypothetical protein